MIDHNERAAEARALRSAAADARAMHNPIAPDCEEWAGWLDARADRVLSGVTHVADRGYSSVQPPNEPASVAVAARSAGKASAMVDQLLALGRARGIKVSVVQPPTREQIAAAVGAVLFNASNYPRKVTPHILGQDIAPLRFKVTDAVLALFPQPTRSACICGPQSVISDGPNTDCPIHGECAEPPATYQQGYDDGFMAGEHDAHNAKTLPAEPPSIADMAPGTVFDGNTPSGPRTFRVTPRAFVKELHSAEWWAIRQIDPSTIRNVTPPPATPEDGDR